MTIRTLFLRTGIVALLLAPASVAQYSHKPGPTAAPTSPQEHGAPKYQIVDGHFHLLNFVQETDEIDAFLKIMDATGVPESIIIGMPVVKEWEESQKERPTYYLDDDGRTYWYSATDFLVGNMLMGLSPDKRKRLHPFDEPRYRARNLIERMFCRLKDWRRIATRYDKLAVTFISAIHLAAVLTWWT